MSKNDDGVIVGTSQRQEWLLPWWWMHYRLYNNHPVTFINFGDLSPKAIDWCKQRGSLISLNLSDQFLATKEMVDPSLAQL